MFIDGLGGSAFWDLLDRCNRRMVDVVLKVARAWENQNQQLLLQLLFVSF